MHHTIVINGETYSNDEAIAYATTNWPFRVANPDLPDALFMLRTQGYKVEVLPPMCVVGIDNGLDGGVVILSQAHGQVINKRTMPTRERKGKREVDVVALRDWLVEALDHDLTKHVFAMEEPVGSKSLNAAKSMAASFHAVRGMLEGQGVVFVPITAREWQKAMLGKVDDTKEAATKQATTRWADEDWRRSSKCKNMHDGMVDAAMIAEYYRTTHV